MYTVGVRRWRSPPSCWRGRPAARVPPRILRAPPTAASPSPSADPTPAEPEVTLAEAGEVFTTFVATDSVLRASGDLRLAMEYVRDSEARLTAVAYLSSGG
ncbi:hypothetical protein ACFSTC_48815 [Nonomuraea ferruginea]